MGVIQVLLYQKRLNIYENVAYLRGIVNSTFSGQVEKEHNSNLPENERIPEDDACTIIRPGINRDGYWTSDNLVDQ
ncbi:8862_t:CDS:2, partial [Entrophospora sp. SA101]